MSPRKGSGKKKKSSKAELSALATADEVQVVAANNITSEKEKKKQNFIVRTIWTVVMIAGFFIILGAGHFWVISLISVILILTYKEVIRLAHDPSREKALPFSKALTWYFLASTLYFLYGERVIFSFKEVFLVDRILRPLATHHRFISFMLYVIGFMFFVSSLQNQHYKFQFTQFAFIHVTLLLVVVQGHFIMSNIFNGMFWVFFPCSLVIINDIFAYLCGITFGKTPLIKISPKKTVEGFLGAWISTIVIGTGLSYLLIKWPYMICPVTDFKATVLTGMECVPNPIFTKQAYKLPQFLIGLFGTTSSSFEIEPVYLHVVVLASFASLIAPFGGFFASGLKRTFQIKDFGDTIPGHGGITDRMDCQFLMGFFTYIYYDSFISTHNVLFATVLETAIQSMTVAEQFELVAELHNHLFQNGYIKNGTEECLDKVRAVWK
ncbi:cytidylyltransferase family-domain-containing protein [Lipomyces japonicus]|uniref:cytidylyltransferase family-domain-containing protein n=1 Tax=Lipomyces japonicus TaxID=56871 RepID=UPI0034CDEDEE